MVVIASERIPDNKKVFISLTYVYGIENTTAKKIATLANVENKKISELTSEEISKVVKETENFLLEDKLREEVNKKINEKISLGTYQGKRLEQGLPVRGQSTHRNSRTSRKRRMGVKSASPTKKKNRMIKGGMFNSKLVGNKKNS